MYVKDVATSAYARCILHKEGLLMRHTLALDVLSTTKDDMLLIMGTKIRLWEIKKCLDAYKLSVALVRKIDSLCRIYVRDASYVKWELTASEPPN